MKAGQLLTSWWQRYVLGELKTPQDIFRLSQRESPDQAQASDRFFSTPDDGVLFDAPQRLKAPSLFLKEAYLSQSHRADWAYADPRLMRWAALFIEYARKRGIPLYVHCALRSESFQNALKAQGRSFAAYPRSAHNIGEAVDIVHSVFHWELSKQEWLYLNALGNLALERVNSTLKASEKLSLTWGGDFRSLYDPAHWEISDYRKRIRALPPAASVHLTPRAILARYKA